MPERSQEPEAKSARTPEAAKPVEPQLTPDLLVTVPRASSGRLFAAPPGNPGNARWRGTALLRLQHAVGNSHVQRAFDHTSRALQRQAGQPETAPAQEPEQPPEKRYTVRLTTGTFEKLTEEEALGKLWSAYEDLNRQVERFAGEHETLKQSRDANVAVGAGGFLADLFMGKKLPPVSIWDKPRNLLTAAKLALSTRAIPEAGNNLKQAGDAYKDSKAKFDSYRDDLQVGGGATQVAIGAIPVAVLVIGVTVLLVAPAAAGGAAAAGGGGTAAAGGGAATGGGAAAAGTAGGGAAAAAGGGAVVGGGVGGSAAMATTMATGQTVAGIAAQAAALLASGDTAALTAMLTSVAATPAGRQAMLQAARTVVASMQSPGVLQREFQFLKQLSEILFQFARGG